MTRDKGDSKVNRLATLCHYRWVVPVLAELRRSRGSRSVTLEKRLGISRDSLRRTLEALISRGWAMRNPGHGHPLRPEYILTPTGAELAPWCVRLMRVLAALNAHGTVLRKWSMPVALALRSGRTRFSEVRAFVPGLTPRALTLTLKDLQREGLVERLISDGYPPATCYRLTPRARKLKAMLDTF